MKDNAVAVFIKYPEAGAVKTRLGKQIGYETAALLYRLLVQHLLENLDESEYDILLFIEPYEKLAEFKEWLDDGTKFYPQKGGDLGERMHNALLTAFDIGYEKCIVAGSDIPDLTGEHISEGFEKLECGDCVIGESVDGGYYLIGFCADSLTDTVFKDMKWSTGSVFEETVSRLESSDYAVEKTEILRDLDDIDDFQMLSSSIKKILDGIDL